MLTFIIFPLAKAYWKRFNSARKHNREADLIVAVYRVRDGVCQFATPESLSMSRPETNSSMGRGERKWDTANVTQDCHVSISSQTIDQWEKKQVSVSCIKNAFSLFYSYSLIQNLFAQSSGPSHHLVPRSVSLSQMHFRHTWTVPYCKRYDESDSDEMKRMEALISSDCLSAQVKGFMSERWASEREIKWKVQKKNGED